MLVEIADRAAAAKHPSANGRASQGGKTEADAFTAVSNSLRLSLSICRCLAWLAFPQAFRQIERERDGRESRRSAGAFRGGVI